MPPVETILVEEPAARGAATGAKGMGEAVLVPTAAAVAGALHAFDGDPPDAPADARLAGGPGAAAAARPARPAGAGTGVVTLAPPEGRA